MIRGLLFLAGLFLFPGGVRAQSPEVRCLIPGVKPGRAQGVQYQSKGGLVLSNSALAAEWNMLGRAIGSVQLENLLVDRKSSQWLRMNGNLFEVHLRSGLTIASSEMEVVHGPTLSDVPAIAGNPRLSSHIRGRQIQSEFVSHDGTLDVLCKAILLDQSNYIREELTFSAPKGDLDVDKITLIDGTLDGATVKGTVRGSPIASEMFFCGFEHPMARSKVEGDHITSWIERKIPITASAPVTYSAVFGVSPEGQMRRAFLNYVERERAHPYRPFLHYNSWLDISYGAPFTADQSVDSINAFGQELVQKRGVKLQSFLFDDGWDDTHSVWEFNNGFPNGFTPLKETAAIYHAAPGVWLSPWGGYGDARTERLATGKAAGYEIDREGFALSGPKYFERFRQVCLDFVGKYGVNQFKFDGTGSPDKHTPGSKFDSDFEAAIQLIHDLRGVKQDLFINLTTGTWPSPFWLRYADSTWRGGSDSDYAGVGTWRQKWITYRDGDTYTGVVKKGPLYPISSLMLHGIIYAKAENNLKTDPGNDFRDEVRSYFGTGTQLQEMYITHSLLTSQNWDDLAEAAKWSQANADELLDTHWLGGDPRKLEVYGWAAWCPRKASIVLRNPNDKPQSFSFDPGEALEIRAGLVYRAHSPWQEDTGAPSIRMTTGSRVTIDLKPFEVRTLDLLPMK